MNFYGRIHQAINEYRSHGHHGARGDIKIRYQDLLELMEAYEEQEQLLRDIYKDVECRNDPEVIDAPEPEMEYVKFAHKIFGKVPLRRRDKPRPMPKIISEEEFLTRYQKPIRTVSFRSFDDQERDAEIIHRASYQFRFAPQGNL